jgi:glutamate carboxypeptidase
VTAGRWREFFEGRTKALEEILRGLVERESPSDDTGRVSALAEWICGRLSEAGLAAGAEPLPGAGAAAMGRLGGGGGTLLLCHHDTVWPAGSLSERPFAIEAGRARGPGVFDMKGGIAVAIAALEGLVRQGSSARATLLSTPDEEIGSRCSRALIEEEARRHERVLVLEPSIDGGVKVARKGTANFRVSFRGVASHAGLSPERGASALAELARFVLFAETLGEADKGTTVVPTVARAGEKTNVVPEAAHVILDSRGWTIEEFARVEKAITDYRPQDGRVSVSVEAGVNRPPMEPSEASRALYERARRIAREIGFEMGAARVGGASDGNLTAALGVPTLDGLGPRGDGAHERSEWVEVADLPRRAALVAALLEPA